MPLAHACRAALVVLVGASMIAGCRRSRLDATASIGRDVRYARGFVTATSANEGSTLSVLLTNDPHRACPVGERGNDDFELFLTSPLLVADGPLKRVPAPPDRWLVDEARWGTAYFDTPEQSSAVVAPGFATRGGELTLSASGEHTGFAVRVRGAITACAPLSSTSPDLPLTLRIAGHELAIKSATVRPKGAQHEGAFSLEVSDRLPMCDVLRPVTDVEAVIDVSPKLHVATVTLSGRRSQAPGDKGRARAYVPFDSVKLEGPPDGDGEVGGAVEAKATDPPFELAGRFVAKRCPQL